MGSGWCSWRSLLFPIAAVMGAGSTEALVDFWGDAVVCLQWHGMPQWLPHSSRLISLLLFFILVSTSLLSFNEFQLTRAVSLELFSPACRFILVGQVVRSPLVDLVGGIWVFVSCSLSFVLG